MRVEYDDIIYLINQETKTACIIGSNSGFCDKIIPKSINKESEKYIITSISKNAFENSQIKSIRFEADSELQVIEENAFYESSIENISIPSQLTIIQKGAFYSCEQLRRVEIPDDSNLRIIDEEAFAFTSIESLKIPSKLEELRSGWGNETPQLMKIEVSPNNPYFKLHENQCLLKKSFINQSNYDQLVCGLRKLKKITIPNFIKTICSFVFSECANFQSIEFEYNS